ncbi:geranylgeranylglyceryl/heptaprenylglyceryl phosphate synthase [candidate division WOR-3 bacterium]|nr:geranylgeranylglyceryl/heptaprenylglyceryl phosphate synthase [candidate division WOR-3 bacterium]
MSIYSYLLRIKEVKGAGFFLLIDPDKREFKHLKRIVPQIEKGGADAIFVGGSTYSGENLDGYIKEIKKNTTIPIILFPASHLQISKHADAILFMSLLSGRNPLYLVDEPSRIAPLIKKHGCESISCGYILIDGGCSTSVANISNTLPIPRNRIKFVKYHALTAQYFGMKLVYLEAGSGAKLTVPDRMINAVKSYIDLPVIVGGGIKDTSVAQEKIKAGADFIVVGNAFEGKECIEEMVRKFAESIHRK